MTKKQKKVLIRIIISAVLLVAFKLICYLAPVNKYVELVLFLIPYLVIGYDILKKAVHGIFHGEVFDENFLMAIATVGAIALGEYVEGAAVMLFYQIGELFQSYAVGKSRKNITALMDIRPDYANIEQEGGLEQVDPDDVEIGTIIVVKPGEKIPIDGIVVSGESTLNTSALTGESLPRSVKVKDEVISGCVNLTGLLKIETTKEFGESTVSKILDLVENSSMKKSRSENFITRFSKVYTPAVCIGALVLAVIPPVVSLIMGNPAEWSKWLIRALTTLVISCPCALVISIPLSFFGGIGGASSRGILIKGSNYLENLSKAKYVVCDKTGTLTKAAPTVKYVYSFNGDSEDELLRMAACMEEHFPHSMAKAVVDAAAKKNLRHEEMHTKVEYIVAHGISTTINNKKTIIGSYHFVFEDEGCTVPEGRQEMFDNLPEEYSHLYLAIEDKLAAVICIEDPVRPEAKEVISSLKELGISKVVMMTGDSERTAKAIAGKVGVDEYYSEVLPEDKASFVEKEKAAGRKVIMIGDGINDSPALSAADVGIAISDGAQIAREIADITVSADDLGQIVYLKDLSNNLIKKINRNYRTIVSFNSGLIALGVLGVIQPTTSALLHNTSTLFISMNSMKNITLAEEHK